MQQYYRLMKSILFVLFLSFGMISCEKEDPVSTSPNTRQTDNTDPTDPDPTDPVVRSDNEQTVFMYLPWSTDLTSFFYQNIADLKSIIGQNILKNERVLVFMCTTATKATLYELSYEKGAAVQKALKSYNYPTPSYTTAEGITSILNDVQTYSPAKRYAMIIGCHGMGWIPVSKTQSRSSLQTVKKHWEYGNTPMTRLFGGRESKYQTDITTLAEGISSAGLKMEYILFDDCYMSTVEVAYDLKNVTSHLIASTSEIMAYGMPYDKIGQYLIGNIDYEKICDGFYSFYSNYVTPCGTISVTDCSEIDNLAAIMKEINQRYTFNEELISSLQSLDGYKPSIFFDCGDYVAKLCSDPDLLEQFNEQLKRTVPYKRNTEYYFTAISSYYGERKKINTFSGITISDPSTSAAALKKNETAWYVATH